MTTTINVTDNGQVELPKEFRQRKKIKAGTPLRVTEVGEGIYITPIPDPTEKELKEVIAAAGSLSRPQTEEEATLVQDTIREYRSERRSKGR
jgi:AbrB family looped-hinge helix DNA binding protein